MRRTRRAVPITLVAGLLGAGLVAGPASAAGSDEPTTSTNRSGDVEYTDPSLADEPTTTVEGLVRTVTIDRGKGKDVRSESGPVLLFADDGAVLPLALDADQVVKGRATAELVKGPDLDAALAGESADPVEVADAVFSGPTANAATPRAHRAYVLTVPAAGSYNGTSAATLTARVKTGLDYWKTEAGGSITSFTQPVGLRTLSASATPADKCGFTNPGQLWSAGAERYSDVNFNNPANHLVVLVPDVCIEEGYGLGTVGSDRLASSGAVTMLAGPEGFTHTLSHELGHNFGLDHANSVCDGVEICEYFDLYSVMGLGVSNFAPPALDSAYRSWLDIAASGELTTVASGTTKTVSLAPRGATSGVRGVRATAGGTDYWIEWRSGTGRDATSYYPLEDTEGAYIDELAYYARGVTITELNQVESEFGVTAGLTLDPVATASNGVRTYALKAGKTFKADGLSVTVGSIGSTANVTVANGPQLPDVPSSTPTISGTPRVYQTLTANTGEWAEGTTFTYQWFLGSTPIKANATSKDYYLTAGTLGKNISVEVTGSAPGFSPVTRRSAATAPIAAAPVVAGSTPTVSGTKRVGSVLTANPGTWTEGAELTYQWYLGSVPIQANATSKTYLLTAGSRGKTVSVRVTGSKAGFTPTTKASAASTIDYGILTAPTPVVEGSKTVGSTLTASTGEWTPGTTLTYQWYLGTTPIISNAKSKTYLLTAGSRGKFVSVRVTGTKAGYTTVTKSSAQFGPIG